MIEAACRVALRMLGHGRGDAAALQFLINVAARHFGLPVAIVGKREIPSMVSHDHVLPEQPARHGEPDWTADYWSTPIRTCQKIVLGELRVRVPERDQPDDISSKALEMVARTAAEIMTRSASLQ